jgi:hypothetical protein
MTACMGASVLLGKLLSIRICTRDPGQQILVKQRLVGIDSDPFAFSGYFAMAATTQLFMAKICFFGFGPSHSLQAFYTFWQLFT